MRKMTVIVNMSLDGVMQAPGRPTRTTAAGSTAAAGRRVRRRGDGRRWGKGCREPVTAVRPADLPISRRTGRTRPTTRSPTGAQQGAEVRGVRTLTRTVAVAELDPAVR